MIKVKFPIKLLYSADIIKHAVNHLNCKVMQMSSKPLFIFIAESGGIYTKDNAIEFGVSHYRFVEQRDFLKIEIEKKIVLGMYVSLLPKIPGGTTRIFSVVKENYNYIYDDEDHAFYRANYDITILKESQIKIMRAWGVLR